MTEPLTGARRPSDTDPPLAGSQITRAVNELAPFTVPRFDTSAQRDAAYSAFVAGGGTMKDGMRCAVGSVQYARAGGTWVVMWTPTPATTNSDIAFVAFTNANGWVARSLTTSGYEVVNRWAMVNINFSRATWEANQLIFTLPVGVRPTRTRYFLGQYSSVVKTEVRIESSGQIIATDSGTSGIVLSVSYPVA